MKKVLALMALGFLGCAQAEPPCKEVYENGIFLGCAINRLDPILNSRYGGPVYNNYNGFQVTGFSMFSVDEKGNYTGWSLVRPSDKDCLKEPHTWTGRIFRLTSGQYAAWNTGSEGGGYYLITLDKSGKSGNSALMAAHGEFGVVETNQLSKLGKGYNTEMLLKVSQPFMCK